MGIEREEGVNGTGTQPDDTNPNPESHEGSGTEERKEENRIPQSRVEEMWARREAKMRKEWEEKELAPLRGRFEQEQQRLVQAELARLEKMGWYTPEQPKPVTQADFEKVLNERFEKAERARREEQYQMYYTQRITDGWRDVTRAHPDLAKEKWFQDSVLAAFAENPKANIPDIADDYAKRFETTYASFAEKNAKARENQRRPDRKVVPSGRGAAGGSRGEEKPKGVGAKLLDKLRSREE